MRYFNCLVKLGGEPILMQAPRLHISEDEVKVLRHLHGDDAISQLAQIAEHDTDRAQHLYQLARFYGNRKMIEDLFRVALDNFEGWLEDAILAEDQERDQRMQMQQIQAANRRQATITEGASLAAPEVGQARGKDPNGNDTTGVAAAAAALEKSVTENASKDVITNKKSQAATLGKHQPQPDRVSVD